MFQHRTLLIRANAEGIINKQPYDNLKLTSVRSERPFLSEEDLEKINQLDLSHNPSLNTFDDEIKWWLC